MIEAETLSQILQLPLSVVLSLVVVFLWRRQENIQKKYEDKLDILHNKYEIVLIEMSTLRGRVDVEITLEKKIDKVLDVLIDRKNN